MKRLALPLFLAACGAQPSPMMFGATRTDVAVAGHDYAVFQKDTRVEVIRLGYAPPRDHAALRATMIELIPAVTGCRLRDSTLQGDSGAMRGRVTCPQP